MTSDSKRRNSMPIKCTACGQSFSDWQAWNEHREIIPAWRMPRYGNHTRRCMTAHEWAISVLMQARRQMEATREKVCVEA